MVRRAEKVIPIRRRGNKWTAPEQVMNQLRLELYDESAKEIAEACGVTAGCIYAIRSGRTKWPRGETLFALLGYAGYTMRWERSNAPKRR